jgi:hypothetical protein
MKPLPRNLLRLFDLLLFPFTVVALAWLRLVRFGGMRRMPCSRTAIRIVGVFPLRDHFYDPMFHPRHLTPGFDLRERALPGIDLDVAGQLELLARFDYAAEIEALAKAPRGPGVPDLLADNFGAGDSEFLYSVVRHFQPRRIFEVGSGNSSLVSIGALARNRAADPARGGELVCIDPHAPAKVDATGARVVRRKVEELGRPFFAELDRGDVLFIDSSHVIRPQGDVLFEFLELLPTLRPGVLVHVHDVYTPRDYPAALLVERACFWNEQYLLEAFLTGNRDFRVIGALNHLWHHHFDALAAKCPLLKAVPAARPGSFWMVRT